MKQTQKMQVASYLKMVERLTPKSEKLMSMIRAFAVGGFICMLGQGITDFCIGVLQFDKDVASMGTSIAMIFIGATLTGIGVYDKIGKFAGAGSIVPITGFANSIVAPAMEYKREGYILGVGAKMFVLAGPVLVYGTIASIVVGLINFFFGGQLGG